MLSKTYYFLLLDIRYIGGKKDLHTLLTLKKVFVLRCFAILKNERYECGVYVYVHYVRM
jgi:hypothetical protein